MFRVSCNSGATVSPQFEVTVNAGGGGPGGGSCQMNPSSGSPSPRTLTSDLVIPLTDMWSGTYADCSC